MSTLDLGDFIPSTCEDVKGIVVDWGEIRRAWQVFVRPSIYTCSHLANAGLDIQEDFECELHGVFFKKIMHVNPKHSNCFLEVQFNDAEVSGLLALIPLKFCDDDVNYFSGLFGSDAVKKNNEGNYYLTGKYATFCAATFISDERFKYGSNYKKEFAKNVCIFK
jgi:hypothetical protein